MMRIFPLPGMVLALLILTPASLFSETLTLEEAVRLAAQSPVVRRAAAARQSAQAEVLVARAPASPEVTAAVESSGAGMSWQAGPISFSAEVRPSQTVSLGARWNLWPQDLPDLALASALEAEAAAAQSLVSARLRAGLQTRYTYQVLQLDALRTSLAEEAAAAARARLERAERSGQNLGRAALLELRRQEAGARLSLRKAADAEAFDRRNLERLTGRTTPFLLEPRQAPETAGAFDETSLGTLAEERSALVLAVRRKVALAQTRLSAAQARSPFSVQLRAGVERSPADPSPVLTYGVQAGYVFPDDSVRDAAAAEVFLAQQELEAARAAAADALARQLGALEEKSLELEALGYARDQARELLLEAQSQLSAGAVTADDLAAVRRAHAEAQLDFEAAVVGYQYLAECLRLLPGEEPL